MAIQDRLGNYDKFNPDKLLPGEWATVVSGDPKASDGRAVYKCFEAGNVKRMATYEDMIDNVEEVSTDVVDRVKTEFTAAMQEATTYATEQAAAAESAATEATRAAGNADYQAGRAQTAADGIDQIGLVLQSEKGAANGVASLDSLGKVPNSQIPDTITAAKFAAVRTIDGMNFDGTANIDHYALCSTAAATTVKTVSLTGFSLASGAKAVIKFTNGNTASNPTIDINSTGAKPIYYRGTVVLPGYITTNAFVELVYDGVRYNIVGDLTQSQVEALRADKIEIATVTANGGTCWKFSNGLAIAAKTVSVSVNCTTQYGSSYYCDIGKPLGNLPITFKSVLYRSLMLDGSGAEWVVWYPGSTTSWSGTVFPYCPVKATAAANKTLSAVCVGTWK